MVAFGITLCERSEKSELRGHHETFFA
jgi:hypothetical protein